MLAVICVMAFAQKGAAQSPCQPSFTPVIGANGSVVFNASAVGYSSITPGTFFWYYGVAGATSSGPAPQGNYTYTSNGVYVVTLVYTNAAMTCSAAINQSFTINNASNPCGLNAAFAISQSGNGLVNITNTSTGTLPGSSYLWQFGDGGFSTSQNPGSHTYASNGNYTIKLLVNNNTSPGCVDSLFMNITVNSYCNLAAGFSFIQNNGTANFSNTTSGQSGPTVYSWNFGDGNTSTAFNPSHAYANGTYTVTLTASNGSVNPFPCSSTATQVITITNTCVANATFSMAPTGTPQFWNAFPMFPANVVAATWSWGDGSTSNTLYTSHTYSAASTYSICLSVTVACGATANYCTTYAIYRSSQDNNIITVNVVNPSVATGINSAEAAELNYSIFPNPNNGLFNLSLNGLNSDNVNVSVYSVVGKLVYQSEGSSNNGTFSKDISLDGVSNGVYFIKVASDNKVITKKVIVENNK